jgi:preprotein translocase YajC subunit
MFNLLAEGGNTGSWIMVVVLLLVMVGFMVYSNYTQKKRQKETQETLNAVQPGNKVKTIGGICGVVVEVCPEDGTFVIETGTEKSGKSYIKFDKQAIYQTDAVVKKEEKVEEVKAEEPVEEPVEEKTEESNE